MHPRGVRPRPPLRPSFGGAMWGAQAHPRRPRVDVAPQVPGPSVLPRPACRERPRPAAPPPRYSAPPPAWGPFQWGAPRGDFPPLFTAELFFMLCVSAVTFAAGVVNLFSFRSLVGFYWCLFYYFFLYNFFILIIIIDVSDSYFFFKYLRFKF